MKPGSYQPEGSPVERSAERQPSQGDKEKLNNIFRASISDEGEAITIYTGFQELLRRAGQRRMAEQVAGIARDESRHRALLQQMQIQLLQHWR